MSERPAAALALAYLPRSLHATLPMAAAVVMAALVALPARAQDQLIVTHAVGTFGLEDLTYPADFTHLSYVNPDAPQGGEMSMSWSSAGGSFDSLHPYTNQGNPAVLANIFFESMLEGTLDTIGESYCLLCETIAFPEDRSYVIFTIREEARFSDGAPVTAQDVLFSYEILRDEGLPSFRANIPLTLDSAEVIDARTIRFNFNPESQLRGRIEAAGRLPVFRKPSHVASGRAFNESRLTPLVGSGPYVVGEWRSGPVRDVRARCAIIGAMTCPSTGDGTISTASGLNTMPMRLHRLREGLLPGNYLFRQENSSQNWANSYDFPRLSSGVIDPRGNPSGADRAGAEFRLQPSARKIPGSARARKPLALMFNFGMDNRDAVLQALCADRQFPGKNTHPGGQTGVAAGVRNRRWWTRLRGADPRRGVSPIAPFVHAAVGRRPDALTARQAAPRQRRCWRRRVGRRCTDGMPRNAAGQTLEVGFLNAGPLFDRTHQPLCQRNLRAPSGSMRRG